MQSSLVEGSHTTRNKRTSSHEQGGMVRAKRDLESLCSVSVSVRCKRDVTESLQQGIKSVTLLAAAVLTRWQHGEATARVTTLCRRGSHTFPPVLRGERGVTGKQKHHRAGSSPSLLLSCSPLLSLFQTHAHPYLFSSSPSCSSLPFISCPNHTTPYIAPP